MEIVTTGVSLDMLEFSYTIWQSGDGVDDDIADYGDTSDRMSISTEPRESNRPRASALARLTLPTPKYLILTRQTSASKNSMENMMRQNKKEIDST
jgi:hypothetical protein